MTEWILSSSILILVVIALRTVFKGKISLRLQYAIWGLVLLRLLIPVSFGSTGFSVANLTASAEPPAIVIQSTNPNENVQVEHPVQQPQVLPNEEPSQNISQNEPVAEESGVDLSAYAIQIVWGIGFVCVAGLFLLTNLRFKQRIMASRYGLDVQKKNLDVYATGEIDTPCLFGIKNPAIYVTYPVADDPTLLRHTLEHEATHHRHGDHIWAVLRCVCLAIHWYNPLVWWAAFLSQRDAELACDEATIKRLGEGERAEYGRTLIGMTCQRRANVLITATTMNSGKSGIKERILLIAKKPRMALYTLLIVMLVSAIAVGCTFTGANPQSTEDIPDKPESEENILLQVLKNKTLFYSVSNDESCTLTDYCTDESERMGLSVSIFQYAFVDMNDDGIQEAVVNFRFGENSQAMCMVLNWNSSSDIVSGTEFYYRQMSQIKEDGSFSYSGGSDNDGWAKLRWENDAWITEFVEDSSHKANIQWNSYPIIDDDSINDIVETEAPDDAQPEDLPEIFSEEFDKNKVCIAVLPTGISVEGGDYRYIIPENQEDLLEYYTAANASAHTYTKWDSSNLRSGWWIVYQDMWWQVTESGAMFGIDNETFDGICIDADDARDLYEFCDAEVKAAGMVEPVRPEELTAIKSATLHWNGTHTVTDEYALNKLEKWFSNSRESSSVSCWFTAPLVLEMEDGTIRTITMATDSCAYYMTEGVAYGFGEITEEGINGNEEFYSLFAPSVIHEKSREGMDVVNEYMIYLNWSRYANQYGVDETFALIDMIEKWASEEPTFNRFGGAIGWTTGLDGAYTDYYAAMLARLYELAPSEFAWACLGNATDANEQNTLQMLAYHWNITPEEAREKLEADIPQN